MNNANGFSYWNMIWRQFLQHRLGAAALAVVGIYVLAGIYAPFLASSKPFVVRYDGNWYFPLFRYLFYPDFFTKKIDVFFNLMIFTFPFLICSLIVLRHRKRERKIAFTALAAFQIIAFLWISLYPPLNPASDPALTQERQKALVKIFAEDRVPTFEFDLKYMTPYAKLNNILRFRQHNEQHQQILDYIRRHSIAVDHSSLSTLWQVEENHEAEKLQRFQEMIRKYKDGNLKKETEYRNAMGGVDYILEKRKWLQEQNKKVTFLLMPPLRHFHWEEDAGGEQSMNQFLPWWELTRINRKDLVSALIFGVRISLVVGILAVGLAMAIGIPVGSMAGYYGGKFDIVVCRLLEIWESMPTFFMLLLVVAMTQSKSIFLVIAVVGIFGWTSFSRYIRGEFFKQRNLPYVEACHALGFNDGHIIFSHILPNAIPPLLTLLPFAIMGAITSEAGLSFLGLGEEGSCSWGVLMDEGRSAFPGESYLLWPPAILLTFLLVSIALVGDALRDALDPKMYR